MRLWEPISWSIVCVLVGWLGDVGDEAMELPQVVYGVKIVAQAQLRAFHL